MYFALYQWGNLISHPLVIVWCWFGYANTAILCLPTPSMIQPYERKAASWLQGSCWTVQMARRQKSNADRTIAGVRRRWCSGALRGSVPSFTQCRLTCFNWVRKKCVSRMTGPDLVLFFFCWSFHPLAWWFRHSPVIKSCRRSLPWGSDLLLLSGESTRLELKNVFPSEKQSLICWVMSPCLQTLLKCGSPLCRKEGSVSYHLDFGVFAVCCGKIMSQMVHLMSTI